MRFQQISQRSLRPRLEILEDRTLMSTCHVTRLADTGQGTDFRGDLRYCINKVNAEPGADVIEFEVTGTINLNSPLPNLSSDIDIQGPGADSLKVRRNTTTYQRIFNVLSNATVTVSGISIANGSFYQGGGIYNSGRLTIDGVGLESNRAGIGQNPTGDGGGVYNGIGATLIVRASTIRWNTVSTYPFNSTPRGGGIFNAGRLKVTDSIIHGNHAVGWRNGGHGGGVYNMGLAVIERTTISNNECGTTYDPIHSYADGAGVYNRGHVNVHNSTVAGNYCDTPYDLHSRGGGFFNRGRLLINHSTVANNRAEVSGSGIYSESGEVIPRNTIVATNYPDDILGGIASAGHNLIFNSSGGSGYAPTDILGVYPMLLPLADNGGPTLTMALLPDSPAIDAGDNADAPEFDQRGPGFPRIVNGTIDIGAFEVQSTGAPSQPYFFAFLITADADPDGLEIIQ